MGKVFLIGAGPGDPELMTLRAARALAEADVILIDDLVSRGCLAHARPEAMVIPVGKRAGCRSTPQAFIERLMVRHARQGRIVARLKGGDPFIFGRGGEELGALFRAGIDVEVVPGITAGIGAGVPLTHRDIARGVTFITGHTKDGSDPDWTALARAGTTLVIYMGLKRLPEIATALLAAGMRPDTPACAVENATLKIERRVRGTLASLPLLVSRAALAAPVVIVIGEVVRYAQELGAVPDLRAA